MLRCLLTLTRIVLLPGFHSAQRLQRGRGCNPGLWSLLDCLKQPVLTSGFWRPPKHLYVIFGPTIKGTMAAFLHKAVVGLRHRHSLQQLWWNVMAPKFWSSPHWWVSYMWSEGSCETEPNKCTRSHPHSIRDSSELQCPNVWTCRWSNEKTNKCSSSEHNVSSSNSVGIF